jgi:hypothetical protein
VSPQVEIEDITKRFPADKFSIHAESESREDADARRRESLEDKRHQHRRSLILTAFAILMVSAIFSAALVAFETGSADDKKWAAGFLSSICFSLVGYLVGKESK